MASGLQWKIPSIGSKYQVKQGNGFALGAEVGYQWDTFFSSIGFQYSQSTLDSIDLGSTVMSFVGREYLFGLSLIEE